MELMFGSDKLILTRCGDFVDQGYSCNLGRFVLNTTCEVANNVENTSTCISESLEMWDARLGHLSVNSFQ